MKKLPLLLSIALLLTAAPIAAANAYAPLTLSTTGTVTDVVDTDSIIVRAATGSILVRLACIDPAASTSAYDVLSKRLMGASVLLKPEPNVPQKGRWSAAYVYQNNVLINETLLRDGQAKLLVTDKAASLYKDMAAAQSSAQAARKGLWENAAALPEQKPYYGDRLNLNTATSAQIRDALAQTVTAQAAQPLANAITYYRERHPFQNISELAYVPGVTNEIYGAATRLFTVSTNLLTANAAELLTLRGMTQAYADAVIEYRAFAAPHAVVQFQTDNILPAWLLSANRPYVALSNVYNLTAAVPDVTVNINTASRGQLTAAGMSYAAATAATDTRATGYALKSLKDISAYSAANWSEAYLNYMADNLHIYTDLNTATERELQSLYGDAYIPMTVAVIMSNRPYEDIAAAKRVIPGFDEIAPYVYVSAAPAKEDAAYTPTIPASRLVNANTATYEQFTAIGLTGAQAAALRAKRVQMFTPQDLPTTVKSAFSLITLYTNVNTAGDHELASLGESFTPAVVEAIKDYRKAKPFGSVAEFVAFCAGETNTDEAFLISNFLSVR